MIRYALVGGLATLVHYVVLIGLVEEAGVKAAGAAMIGATCGALAAYAGNFRFTFMSRAAHRHSLPRFLLVAACGVLVNSSLVWTGTELLQLNYLVPQVAATVLIFLGGFTLHRRWTFA